MPFRKESQIPRTNCFSLGDFHTFDRCVFDFFVRHHLEKKYELAEGNASLTIGSLLDLSMKKFHSAKAYLAPQSYLHNFVKAAENEIRESAARQKAPSFYSAQVPFLTPDVLNTAGDTFREYYKELDGKIPQAITKKTFWERVVRESPPIGEMKLWGGPDSIEMGKDGVPEVADYKYYSDSEKGKTYLDMDLMPKLYVLLTADDLIKAKFTQTRFVVRLWNEPLNNKLYEEFDLNNAQNLEDFFKDKMERILRTRELNFCDKDYCKTCKSDKRDEWIAELKVKGWID